MTRGHPNLHRNYTSLTDAILADRDRRPSVGFRHYHRHLIADVQRRVIKLALIGFRGGEAWAGRLGCKHLVREQKQE